MAPYELLSLEGCIPNSLRRGGAESTGHTKKEYDLDSSSNFETGIPVCRSYPICYGIQASVRRHFHLAGEFTLPSAALKSFDRESYGTVHSSGVVAQATQATFH